MTAPTERERHSERAVRRAVTGVVLLVVCVTAAAKTVSFTAPEVRPNPNTTSAGMLHDGVLTVALEARASVWRFSDSHSPMTVAAFSEQGKAPLMPGPLLRVPVGTQLRLTIRNSLDKPLTFIVPSAVHGAPDRVTSMDSVVIAPNTVDTLSARAAAPGSYVYRGTLPDGASKISRIAGVLAGTIVVDSVEETAHRTDRLFVIMATEDSASSACDDTTTSDRARALVECRGRRFMYTINGTEWPSTSRIHATVGDSLHWRVVNASSQDHPMHLHGFYYRVDALSGPLVDPAERPAPGQLVVTQLLTALASMSITWSPDRPGNWLFHCHFVLHNTPYSMIAMPDDPDMRDMVGLVIGTIVAPRPGAVAAARPSQERYLRLVAEESPAPGAEGLPRMHFVLEEGGRRVDTHTDWSPELALVRGEPVAITIVNHMTEPTSVHWHGVEVEDSYADGAPGFSGAGTHLAPAIAPGDSFVARFTPPRSGTFIYHAHLDELREELAGLDGALIVREPRAVADSDDHVIFFKGQPRDREHPLEIDGKASPDTIVLRVGHPARFRLINLSSTPEPVFWLTARSDSLAAIARDTMLVRWRPAAKDAFDLPMPARAPRLAEQIVSIGETYDAEYTPTAPGVLRIEVRNAGGNHALLIRVPIRVE